MQLSKKYVYIFLLCTSYAFMALCSDTEKDTAQSEKKNIHSDGNGNGITFINKDGYTIDQKADILVQITQAATVGFNKGIIDVTKSTISKTFDGLPTRLHRLGTSLIAFFYRLTYGSRGLTWNSLSVMNARLTTLVSPLTTKTYASTSKEARALLISQHADPNFVDEDWLSLRRLIDQEISHMVRQLRTTLPCYSLKFYKVQRTGLQRMMAGIVQLVSAQDDEQMSVAIVHTIEELELLNKYIQICPTFKDVEQNIEHISRWLSLSTNSMIQLGNMLKYGSSSSELPMRAVDQRAGVARTQKQMQDLFGDAALNSIMK